MAIAGIAQAAGQAAKAAGQAAVEVGKAAAQGVKKAADGLERLSDKAENAYAEMRPQPQPDDEDEHDKKKKKPQQKKPGTLEAAGKVAQSVKRAVDGDFSGLATQALSKLLSTSKGLKNGDIKPEEAVKAGPTKSAQIVTSRQQARAAEAAQEQSQTQTQTQGPSPRQPGR